MTVAVPIASTRPQAAGTCRLAERLWYFAPAHQGFPGKSANNIQMMKVCRGFVDAGQPTTLVVPRRPDTAARMRNAGDLSRMYGLSGDVEIEWCAFPYPLKQLQQGLYAPFAAARALRRRASESRMRGTSGRQSRWRRCASPSSARSTTSTPTPPCGTCSAKPHAAVWWRSCASPKCWPGPADRRGMSRGGHRSRARRCRSGAVHAVDGPLDRGAPAARSSGAAHCLPRRPPLCGPRCRDPPGGRGPPARGAVPVRGRHGRRCRPASGAPRERACPNVRFEGDVPTRTSAAAPLCGRRTRHDVHARDARRTATCRR